MQFMLLVTTITLSTGIGAFVSFERAIQQSDALFSTQVEVAEIQADRMVRALRREIALNPDNFDIPQRQGKTFVLAEDLVENVKFGGMTLDSLISYTIDSDGTIAAVIDPEVYDRRTIAEGILTPDEDLGNTTAGADGGDSSDEADSSDGLSREQLTDANQSPQDWISYILAGIASGDLKQVTIGKMSPAEIALVTPKKSGVDASGTLRLVAAWEN